MNAQAVVVCVFLWGAVACGGTKSEAQAPPQPPATGTQVNSKAAEAILAMHGEAAAGETRNFHGSATMIGADVGFESTGCCGVGTYFSAAHLGGEGNRAERVNGVLQGGLEGAAIVPWTAGRLRLRLRVGKAGTPPKLPRLGRSGYEGGLTVLLRLTSADAPQVGSFASAIDVTAGYTVWTFGSEQSSAGSLEKGTASNALMFGLRLGADYGLDLQ